MNSLTELFVSVDDFWQKFEPIWYPHLLESGQRQRLRASRLCESEIMTILILFHQSQYRTFKAFYTQYVLLHLADAFPNLVSYKRFVALKKRVGIALWVYLRLNTGVCTGISYVDSTSLSVCHNRRIERHRVFKGWAKRGKTTMGWFFGFKLHVVINDLGELVAVHLTPGNVDDRRPLPTLVKRVFGKVFGDKGYLSQDLKDDLWAKGVELITAIRQNMKPQLMTLQDKLLLQRRFIIETIFGRLKQGCQIDHSRHRSIDNFMVNLFAGLIAYCKQDNKPAVTLDPNDYQALLAQ
ncbi:MAG: IS982 family transposase [Chloroflexota bacterium]